MSLDFEIGRLSRRCAATERELTPGEIVYSVVVSRAAEVARLDYCAEAWPGPPEDALGWWKSRVPDPKSTKQQWAPHEILLRFFESLEDQPEQADVRYVTALLLIRRRILQEDPDAAEDAESEAEEHARGLLRLIHPPTEKTYAIEEVEPTAERIALISEELRRLLMSDAGEPGSAE